MSVKGMTPETRAIISLDPQEKVIKRPDLDAYTHAGRRGGEWGASLDVLKVAIEAIKTQNK